MVGFSMVLFFALAYHFGQRYNTFLIALGTLFWVNGIIHLLLSIFTMSYCPGAYYWTKWKKEEVEANF